MNLLNSAGGRSGDLNQIRKQIDGDDTFFSSHRVRTACGAKGKHVGSRGRQTPQWTKTDAGIRRLLLKVFPKLKSDPKQRQLASRWARVIHLYFRMGYTYAQISEEMNLRSPSEKRPYSIIENVIRHIKWAQEGRSTNGSGLRRKRGRPKKFVMYMAHPLEEVQNGPRSDS